MKISEVIDLVKHRLLDRKDFYVIVDEWCGDTEAGFHEETNVDMDRLLAEMDELGEELRAKHGDPEVK